MHANLYNRDARVSFVSLALIVVHCAYLSHELFEITIQTIIQPAVNSHGRPVKKTKQYRQYSQGTCMKAGNMGLVVVTIYFNAQLELAVLAGSMSPLCARISSPFSSTHCCWDRGRYFL